MPVRGSLIPPHRRQPWYQLTGMGRPASKGWWLVSRGAAVTDLRIPMDWVTQPHKISLLQEADLLLQEARKYHSKEMPTEVLHKMFLKFFH